MASQDLTILENLKAWLPINTNTVSDDVTLARLITATSLDFMRATKRPDLLVTTYNEVRTGDGGTHMVLYHWPIVSVDTLKVAGATVGPSADKMAPGWYIDEDIDPERIFNLWLAGGYRFTDGQPLQIGYTAGYAGPAADDDPANILLPEDIEQAVIDWCAYRYKNRPNVGAARRRSEEGANVEVQQVDAPSSVLQVIERYTRVFPSLDRRQDERDERMKAGSRSAAASTRK